MATTTYFEEEVKDQGGRGSLSIELGRSSYYAGCHVSGGTGEDSIYIAVDGKMVVMDLETAKRFVHAVVNVGRYHGLIE